MHAAELEELALQPVARRGRARPGIGGAIALLATGALLAGGLGLLGGRPQPSPSARTTGALAVGPTSSLAVTAAAPTPAVTPYADCGPHPEIPPTISLQTNGVPTAGLVERFEHDPVSTPAASMPADPLDQLRGPRVELQPDVITELWIDGAACALRWGIGLYDPVADDAFQLEESRAEGGLDPRVAAQNRFNLSQLLPPYRSRGNDLQLIGSFEFRDIVVMAWWRVGILPVDVPPMSLRTGSGAEVGVVEGCNIQLRFGNGWTEGRDCEDDLSAAPPASRLSPGTLLSFSFGDWVTDDAVVTCGRLSGLAFIAEPRPLCRLDVPSAAFPAPEAAGLTIIAISTCATGPRGTGVCGTWYAAVEVLAE